MHAAAALSASDCQPEPPPVRASAGPRQFTIATVLAVVLKLMQHGKELARTLPQRVAEPGFAASARSFGSTDPAIIRICLSRGMLRVTALYRMLSHRAARGLPVRIPLPRIDRERRARDRQARAPRPRPWWKHLDLAYLPSRQEAEDEVRRRRVGRILGDICLDFGMSPDNAGMLWHELQAAMPFWGGNRNAVQWETLRRLGMLPGRLGEPRREQRRKPASQAQPAAAPAEQTPPQAAAPATTPPAECKPATEPCTAVGRAQGVAPPIALLPIPWLVLAPPLAKTATTGPP